MSTETPTPAKTGRPLGMTEAVVENLLTMLKLGNYVETSCRAVGISRETFYSWMRRGKEEKEGVFADFRRKAYQAIAEAEVRMLARITTAAETDWHADAWRLERRFPKRWGKRDELGLRIGATAGAAPVKQIVIAFEEPSCATAATPPASSMPGDPSASSSTAPKPGPSGT